MSKGKITAYIRDDIPLDPDKLREGMDLLEAVAREVGVELVLDVTSSEGCRKMNSDVHNKILREQGPEAAERFLEEFDIR